MSQRTEKHKNEAQEPQDPNDYQRALSVLWATHAADERGYCETCHERHPCVTYDELEVVAQALQAAEQRGFDYALALVATRGDLFLTRCAAMTTADDVELKVTLHRKGMAILDAVAEVRARAEEGS